MNTYNWYSQLIKPSLVSTGVAFRAGMDNFSGVDYLDLGNGGYSFTLSADRACSDSIFTLGILRDSFAIDGDLFKFLKK